MNTTDKVAVTSRSFSRNPVLRTELLSRYKRVTFNDDGRRLGGDELVEFLRGHDKTIVALEKISDEIVAKVPELKVISKYGVGIDNIDMEALKRRGICLGWTGGVNKRSVSELVISAAIGLLRHVYTANLEVRRGIWRQQVGNQLTGKTFGIIGCGHIGKDLVRLLQPFECRILVNDIRDYEAFYREYRIEAVGLEDLLAHADVVTLHVPLDDSTRGMLMEDRIALMKPTAVLINTARGELVNEAALAVALREKRLAAAAFDVFAQEPPQDQALLDLPNFLATPHIGGSAAEAILAMGRAAIKGLDAHEIF